MDWIWFGFFFIFLDSHERVFGLHIFVHLIVRFHSNLLTVCVCERVASASIHSFIQFFYFFLALVCRLATMSASVIHAIILIHTHHAFCVAVFIAHESFVTVFNGWQMLAIFALVRFYCCFSLCISVCLGGGVIFSILRYHAQMARAFVCTRLRDQITCTRTPHSHMMCGDIWIQYTCISILIAGDETISTLWTNETRVRAQTETSKSICTNRNNNAIYAYCLLNIYVWFAHHIHAHHIKCIYTLMHGGGGCHNNNIYFCRRAKPSCESSSAIGSFALYHLFVLLLFAMYHSGACMRNCLYYTGYGHGHAYDDDNNKLDVYVWLRFIVVVASDFLWIEIGLENCDNKTCTSRWSIGWACGCIGLSHSFKSAGFACAHVAPKHLYTSNFRAYVAGDFSAWIFYVNHFSMR